MAQTLKEFKALVRAGQLAEAGKLIEKLASAPKADAKTLKLAADFFHRALRNGPKAVGYIQRAVKKRSKDAGTHVLATEIYLSGRMHDAAKHHAAKALAIAPDATNTLVANAAVAIAEDRLDAAKPYVEQALANDPANLDAKYQLTRILIAQAEMDAARDVIDGILTDAPAATEVISLYVATADLQADDPILQRLRDDTLPRLIAAKHPRTQRLLYDMGRAHKAVGSYDAAFEYYTQAKARTRKAYDAKGYRAYVDALCNQISRADYFQRGGGDEEPVLIVGMQQSGATQLAQILTGHPDIASAGQSPSLGRIVDSVGVKGHDGASMVKAIKEMPPPAAQNLSRRYLKETGHDRAMRVIDLSVHNFELLGFFAVMFPKAKILHMQRDPLDTCVACYLQKLPPSHRYAETTEAMGHAYLQYHRLMNHWKTALPNTMMTVQYADLLSDPARTGRKVVDFIGLDWDTACATDHIAEQMSPVGHWLHYASHLTTLKRQLAPLYPDGFDKPAH